MECYVLVGLQTFPRKQKIQAYVFKDSRDKLFPISYEDKTTECTSAVLEISRYMSASSIGRNIGVEIVFALRIAPIKNIKVEGNARYKTTLFALCKFGFFSKK